MRRIYLDNAATSFPKPPGMYEAMLRYGQDVGASPGRGHYAESREGARLIRECRERLNAFLGGESTSHVIFALNTSDALNLAIKGLARARRHASGPPLRLITTAMDHNSVLRPFAALAHDGADVVHVPAHPASGLVDLAGLEHSLARGADLLAINWVSNVTGTIQPIHEMVALARRHHVPTLVDLAQGLGHLPFSARDLAADMLAFPGHKGLLGPQGTGGLYIRPGFEDHLATTREGGTGSISELDDQPLTMPEKFEAGSHNTLGIVGLSHALAWHMTQGIQATRAHELELIRAMLDGLQRRPLPGLRLLGPTDPALRVATFSFVHASFSPAEVVAMLEQHFGILARAGIHCAPRAHQTLGSLDYTIDGIPARGAVRVSFGPFNTMADVLALLDALQAICQRALPVPHEPAPDPTASRLSASV